MCLLELVEDGGTSQYTYFSILRSQNIIVICDVLRNLITFVPFKKRENTHGGVLLLVKLLTFSLQLY